MTAADLLARFPRVRKNKPGDWHVPCPGHDDDTQRPEKFSLHLTETADRLLLTCLAGCPRERVLTKLGLKDADLFFATNGSRPIPTTTTAPRPTLATFAAKKRLDPALLVDAGWQENAAGLLIPYRERDGSTWRMRIRRSLDAGQGFTWDTQKDRPLIPYGRWRLDEALDQGELWLVEGESDTVTAWAHHLPCLGLPGNQASKALTAEDLAGIATLWIVEEPGQSGRGFLEKLRERLRELEYTGKALVVRFAEKDLSDAHVAHGDALAHQIWIAQLAARPLWDADPPMSEAPTAVEAPQPFAEGAGELLAREFPPVEVYIEGVLTAEGSGFIGGEEKLGKTYYALSEALALAFARTHCSRFPVPVRRRVLFIEEEDSPRRTAVRLRALLRGFGLDPDSRAVRADLSTWMQTAVWQGFRLDDATWLARLDAQLRAFPAEVVYLDVLRKLSKKDLNKQAEASELLDALDTVRRTHGCLFRLLHHYRKGQGLRMGRGSQEMGGSYVLGAWTEQSVYLEPIGRKGGGTAFDVQTKDGAASATLKLRWETEGPVHEPTLVRLHLEELKADLAPGEKHADAVLQLLATLPSESSPNGAGVSIGALMQATGKSRDTIRRTLQFLIEKGLCNANAARSTKHRRYTCTAIADTDDALQSDDEKK